MKSLGKLRIPAPVAALALAAGVTAAAASGEVFAPAYGEATTVFGAGAAQIHAANAFVAADANRSGDLDADEFASMRLIAAELAQLNGFVAVSAGDRVERVLLPIAAPASMSAGERARVIALAYREFYHEAGPDGRLGRREFLAHNARLFARFDHDRDGVLQRQELTRFAAEAASVLSGRV